MPKLYNGDIYISQLFPIIAWLPTDIGKLNKTYIIFATTEINARYILSPMEIWINYFVFTSLEIPKMIPISLYSNQA